LAEGSLLSPCNEVIAECHSAHEMRVMNMMERPDFETIEEWFNECHSEAKCECNELTEIDGQCSHGNDSWFLIMGLV
jgi:hypothetical protein